MYVFSGRGTSSASQAASRVVGDDNARDDNRTIEIVVQRCDDSNADDDYDDHDDDDVHGDDDDYDDYDHDDHDTVDAVATTDFVDDAVAAPLARRSSDIGADKQRSVIDDDNDGNTTYDDDDDDNNCNRNADA